MDRLPPTGRDAAESGLFTILGHLDLVKKFGYRPTRSLDRELERLVERIAHAEVLVEINTAGLHRPTGEAYPSLDILRRLCEAGVQITFGSDAHRPDEVGRDLSTAPPSWPAPPGMKASPFSMPIPQGGARGSGRSP